MAHESLVEDRIDDGAIEIVARRKRSVIDVECFDACVTCAIEAGRIRAIRDDNGDLGVEASLANGVDDRLQVAAATRNQDAKASSVIQRCQRS